MIFFIEVNISNAQSDKIVTDCLIGKSHYDWRFSYG